MSKKTVPTPSYLAEPVVQYLSQVLTDIKTGSILVPRFQRGIVWDDDQRIELLRSIYSGTPIGSIMVWRTTDVKLETFSRIGSHLLPSAPEPTPGNARQYLLDGLQRMSTLVGALLAPASETMDPDDDDKERINWNIYFDLEEEDFRLRRARDGMPPAHWIHTQVLLDSVALLKFQRPLAQTEGGDAYVQRADRVANAFRNYKIPVVPIVTNNLEEVTKAFQRINSQGTAMSDVHMVAALTYSTSFDLQLRLEDTKMELAEVGWEGIDRKYILATIRAFENLDIASPNAEQLSKTLKKKPELIAEAVQALKEAARFFDERCGIPSPAFVPYSYQTVIIADAFRSGPIISREVGDELERWFWITTFTSYFLGARGKEVRQALEHVRAIVAHREVRPSSGPQVVDRLPERFDFHGARAKALALLLARRQPLEMDGTLVNTRATFSKHGGASIAQIIKPSSPGKAAKQEGKQQLTALAGPQNRLIYPPEEWVRDSLVMILSSNRSFFDSHAISVEAEQAWKESRIIEFFTLRRATLEDCERDFVRTLGLTYG